MLYSTEHSILTFGQTIVLNELRYKKLSSFINTIRAGVVAYWGLNGFIPNG